MDPIAADRLLSLRPTMSQQPQVAEGPASLNPRSAGCVLTAVAVLAAVVAAWLGMRLLKASSGDMALAAARSGVATAGLDAETRELLEVELGRVDAALQAGQLTPAQVISAVNGLLQTPCLPALRLERVLEVDLPASTLPDDRRAQVTDALLNLWRGLELGEITAGQVSGALGLAALPEGEAAPLLDDDDLLAIQARALEALPEPRTSLEGFLPPPDPVEDFRLHVDAVLEGDA